LKQTFLGYVDEKPIKGLFKEGKEGLKKPEGY